MEAGSTRAACGRSARRRSTSRASRRGSCCPNVDFVSAEHTFAPGTERSPLELGLAWLVDFNKGHFTGRRALAAEQARGPRRQLVGLDIEGNKPAHNALLYSDAGRQAKSAASRPRSGRPLASATSRLLWSMRRISRIGSNVWAEIYLNRELVWERRMVRAPVVERPFFAPERRRATPPADF